MTNGKLNGKVNGDASSSCIELDARIHVFDQRRGVEPDAVSEPPVVQ
jgi:hypothetical protein